MNAFYVLTGNDVSYSIDQLNLLPTDNDFSHLDSNYKTTIKGSAIIKDGRVVKLNNDDVNISTFSELRGNFIFNEENFNNVIVENGYFSADVISPSDFWGMKKDVRDMKIVINYNNSALEIITITYKTSNSEVTTVYMFS